MATLRQHLVGPLCVLAVVLSYLGLYLLYKAYERQFYLDALPAALEVDGVEWLDGQDGIREGCGGVVFRLTPAASQHLRAQGLHALADARQARGHDDAYYHYAAWRNTPAEVGEGWSGLTCGELPMALERRIHQAMSRPGGFITDKHEATLLVLPGEGLVVYAYNG